MAFRSIYGLALRITRVYVRCHGWQETILIEQSIHNKMIHVMSLNLFHIIKNTKCKNKPYWKQFYDYIISCSLMLHFHIQFGWNIFIVSHILQRDISVSGHIYMWTLQPLRYICDLWLRKQYKAIRLIYIKPHRWRNG